ncbi:MAG: hypothetical protein V4529_17180 [Gemmatimonadota bacterium]
MTVRHVEADGSERVFQVESLERTVDGSLVFATHEKIMTGKVYIMNDAGKTVVSCDFDKQKEQKR